MSNTYSRTCRTCGFAHTQQDEACPRWEAPLFDALTFKELQALAAKLLSSSAQTLYEREHLAADPRAVAFKGQAERVYADLTDDTQALTDEVQATARLRLLAS